MAITDTPTKYFVYRNMQAKHGIKLSEDQLDTIEEIYVLDKKQNIFKMGIYRLINAVFAFFFGIILLIFRNKEFTKWMFIGMMFIFLVYNIIQIWNTYLEHKSVKVKQPKTDVNGI
jgi:hypothetical protein